MTNAINFIRLENITSIGIRKGVKFLVTKKGNKLPLCQCVLTDEIVPFSNMRSGTRIQESVWVKCSMDDIAIAGDGARIIRNNIKQGDLIARVEYGDVHFAGKVAIRRDGFEARAIEKVGNNINFFHKLEEGL